MARFIDTETSNERVASFRSNPNERVYPPKIPAVSKDPPPLILPPGETSDSTGGAVYDCPEELYYAVGRSNYFTRSRPQPIGIYDAPGDDGQNEAAIQLPLAKEQATIQTINSLAEEQEEERLWQTLTLAPGVARADKAQHKTAPERRFVSLEERRARAAHLNDALREDADENQLTPEQKVYQIIAGDPGLKAALFVGGDPYWQRETMLECLTKLYLHNEYSFMHSVAVGLASGKLAKAFGFTPKQIAQMQRDGILHDIGKTGVNTWILNAPREVQMTREQVAERETHPTIGHDMLEERGDQVTAESIVTHHQGKTVMQYRRNFMRKGQKMQEQMLLKPYPIAPHYDAYNVLEARSIIMAMIDVGNALASKRQYKEPWERDKIKKVFAEDFRQRLFKYANRRGYAATQANYFMENVIEIGLDLAEEFALIEMQEMDKDGQEHTVIRMKNMVPDKKEPIPVFEDKPLEREFGA